jgi:hypothetical protein
MECDFNLLCYGLFKIPKIVIILKAFKIIKKIFIYLFFCGIFYVL